MLRKEAADARPGELRERAQQAGGPRERGQRESSRERARLTGRADGSWGGKSQKCMKTGDDQKGWGEGGTRRGTGCRVGQNRCSRRNPEKGRNGRTGEGRRMGGNPRGKQKSKPKKKRRGKHRERERQ